MPHWYKLQTHDSSSIPLPQPSPYLPRRHVHGESPSKKLQSTFFFLCASNSIATCRQMLTCVLLCECALIPPLCTRYKNLPYVSYSRTCQPYPVLCVCACVFVCVSTGSHRIIDTEFDDGLLIVTKGGWGACLLVLVRPAREEGLFSVVCLSPIF